SSQNIKFVAGFGVTDTIGAKPLQALVVEIHDATGALMPGTVVRFEASIRSQGLPYPFATMLVSSLASQYFNIVSFDTTNSRGRASALIQLGPLTGTGKIAVTVAELGVQDTAYFTVLPGAAVRVQASPKDTAVYGGATVQLHATVVDRMGNAR